MSGVETFPKSGKCRAGQSSKMCPEPTWGLRNFISHILLLQDRYVPSFSQQATHVCVSSLHMSLKTTFHLLTHHLELVEEEISASLQLFVLDQLPLHQHCRYCRSESEFSRSSSSPRSSMDKLSSDSV